jgi:hypothetical protein
MELVRVHQTSMIHQVSSLLLSVPSVTPWSIYSHFKK